MKLFSLIGAAGYIAPRHMRAIAETGNSLVAALDPNDSVGQLDAYFQDCAFFTEFERFDRHVDLLRRQGTKIDYMSICSPNYLHDSHIRFALRSGADAICEKPIVLNPRNVDALCNIEKEFDKRVYTILQLRLHPKVVELKKMVEAGDPNKIYDVDLTYITSRGRWYLISWKGITDKSGGIATNIGVHFFDMLSFVFGGLKANHLHLDENRVASGYLEFERARVRWFLSIDREHLPDNAEGSTYRSLSIDNAEFEFSAGFTDLHTESYKHILSNGGFGLTDAKTSIEIVADLRDQATTSKGEIHPAAHQLLNKATVSMLNAKR